jgi:hypothetical protein
MLSRFSLAILLAVLAAASKPLATGGTHDLLAFGAVVEETVDGKPVRRLCLGVPEGEARRAYEDLLRSSARAALVQGTTVYAAAKESNSEGARVVEVIFYGHGSRAGRAPVVFQESATPLPGADRALGAARELASLPGTVTAAAARVLLHTEDVEAYREALEALSRVAADTASAEARATALDPKAPVLRRVVAAKALAKLGGAAVHGDVYGKLAADPEPLIQDSVK